MDGYATPEGTSRYIDRFPEKRAAGFYRLAGGLQISSLGLGTYLGQPDDRTDTAYAETVAAAVRRGINFLDTAINYRHQRSEQSIGAALDQLCRTNEFQRDEIVICTKAGFLTPGAVPSFLRKEDVVGGMHSMSPDFLEDQIDRSRANLLLDTLDVFYLHNPETQLQFISRDEFENRIRAAFDRLEQLVARGRIRCYGTATWDGYRKPGLLDIERLNGIAREIAGERHHFRFVQLPFNLGMVEGTGALKTAQHLGITVVASATLLQARLSHDLPDPIAERLPGLQTDAQRAIQFTRSTPGVTVALVGMSNRAHLEENLGVSVVPPATFEQHHRVMHE